VQAWASDVGSDGARADAGLISLINNAAASLGSQGRLEGVCRIGRIRDREYDVNVFGALCRS